MEIDLACLDHDYRSRQLPTVAEAFHDLGISCDRGDAVHPQHVFHARQEEQQPDRWMVNDVGQRIEPVVAGSVREGEMQVVERMNKAGLTATWRYVREAGWLRGADAEERRQLNVPAAVAIEMREALVTNGYRRFRVDAA